MTYDQKNKAVRAYAKRVGHRYAVAGGRRPQAQGRRLFTGRSAGEAIRKANRDRR